MSRRTVANCLLALLLLLPVAGRAEWNPWHPDPIIEYHYNYDNVGNIKSIEDSVKSSTSTFTYDEVNRLKQAIGDYGVNGAPETVNYSYNAVGDIAGTPNLPTDGNGNITQIEGKTIYYDYENRPYKITDSTGTITEFKYDYAGQRVLKKVTIAGATAKTYYVGNIYEVSYSTTGAETQTAHIYAGALRVASRITKNGGSNTYYYLGDHLGSTRMMTDALGQTVHDVTYEPWGNTVTESSTTYKANHKYTGQMLDDSTGLYYYGARYYDPSLKRFITPDTIVQSLYDPQSLNRYAYVRNNPLSLVDPTGHEAEVYLYSVFPTDADPPKPKLSSFQKGLLTGTIGLGIGLVAAPFIAASLPAWGVAALGFAGSAYMGYTTGESISGYKTTYSAESGFQAQKMSWEEQDYRLGVSFMGWSTLGIGYGANAVMKPGTPKTDATKLNLFQKIFNNKKVSVDKLIADPKDDFSVSTTGPSNKALTYHREIIRKTGNIESPIEVRDLKNGMYEIIDGHHRWMAAKQMGLRDVPIKITE